MDAIKILISEESQKSFRGATGDHFEQLSHFFIFVSNPKCKLYNQSHKKSKYQSQDTGEGFNAVFFFIGIVRHRKKFSKENVCIFVSTVHLCNKSYVEDVTVNCV